jgi:hypothetical protein
VVHDDDGSHALHGLRGPFEYPSDATGRPPARGRMVILVPGIGLVADRPPTNSWCARDPPSMGASASSVCSGWPVMGGNPSLTHIQLPGRGYSLVPSRSCLLANVRGGMSPRCCFGFGATRSCGCGLLPSSSGRWRDCRGDEYRRSTRNAATAMAARTRAGCCARC